MVHNRMEIRKKAEIEYDKTLLEVIRKYDLTYGEIFSMLSDSLLRWANYLKLDEDKQKK